VARKLVISLKDYFKVKSQALTTIDMEKDIHRKNIFMAFIN
jgi:hypothetical protein